MGSRTAGLFRFDIENKVKIEASFRLRFDIVAITNSLNNRQRLIAGVRVSEKKRTARLLRLGLVG